MELYIPTWMMVLILLIIIIVVINFLNARSDAFSEEIRKSKVIEEDSKFQLTGYRIQQDIKNERIETTTQVKGNIEGYKEPINVTFHTPDRIEITDQYVARRDKFYKWRELKSE